MKLMFDQDRSRPADLRRLRDRFLVLTLPVGYFSWLSKRMAVVR